MLEDGGIGKTTPAISGHLRDLKRSQSRLFLCAFPVQVSELPPACLEVDYSSLTSYFKSLDIKQEEARWCVVDVR